MKPKEQREMYLRKQKIVKIREEFSNGASIQTLANKYISGKSDWEARRMVKRVLGKKLRSIIKFMEL